MKKILIVFTALFAFIACEKEIELKQEEVDPRIVVNSLFSEGDTIWVHLSESRNILFEETLPNLTSATAQLFDESDNLLGTFTHTTDGNYYLAEPTPVAGNTYKLKVNSEGMKEVTATSETPSIISIASVDTTTAVPGNQIEFTIKINDDATQKNYYGVSIVFHSVYEDEFGEEITYQSPYFSTKELYVINGEADVDGQKWGMEFFFPDDSFNGGSITFKGLKYLETWAEPGSYYVVGLKSMSEDLYKYKVSYSKYLSAQGPFAEPVQVYSNIEDGFGIFGGSSTFRDTIWTE